MNCKKINSCYAPICPGRCDEHAIWYPQEGICTNPEYISTLIVQNQRKLRKLLLKDEESGYYNHYMLSIEIDWSKIQTGLNPDLKENKQLVEWLKEFTKKQEENINQLSLFD